MLNMYFYYAYGVICQQKYEYQDMLQSGSASACVAGMNIYFSIL